MEEVVEVVMSELPKVRKYSSMQAISPQCLNQIVGLGIFPCTALLKISGLIKTTHNFSSHLIGFLQIVEVLRHFVMLFTVTSIFNKAQPVLYTRVVVQWDGTGF